MSWVWAIQSNPVTHGLKKRYRVGLKHIRRAISWIVGYPMVDRKKISGISDSICMEYEWLSGNYLWNHRYLNQIKYVHITLVWSMKFVTGMLLTWLSLFVSAFLSVELSIFLVVFLSLSFSVLFFCLAFVL